MFLTKNPCQAYYMAYTNCEFFLTRREKCFLAEKTSPPVVATRDIGKSRSLRILRMNLFPSRTACHQTPLPTLTTLRPLTQFELPSKHIDITPCLSRLIRTSPTRFETKNLIFATTSPRD